MYGPTVRRKRFHRFGVSGLASMYPVSDYRHRHRPLRGDRQGGDGWPAATAEPSAPRLLRLSQPTRL
jgi:hypothetical protein